MQHSVALYLLLFFFTFYRERRSKRNYRSYHYDRNPVSFFNMSIIHV